MSCVNWKIIFWNLFALISLLVVPVCYGLTEPRDVLAINNLYASLGSPVLPGWVPNGGDPCAESWLGVQCINFNITAIILKDSRLGGELGNRLGDFTSITEFDLSNNHIGGVIPSNLPSTIRTFYLSSNQFTGSIPESLSSLSQLTDLSFDNNNLTGEIPDAFRQISGLINLNLSNNSLSGRLPPSMGNLSYLSTLHLQNNDLIGTLDVLNVKNNLFSRPIPSNLLSIPNFRFSGNPLNSKVLPSPPVSSPLPSPDLAPRTASPDSRTGDESHSSRKLTWIVILGTLLLIFLGLAIYMIIYRCYRGTQKSSEIGRTYGTSFYDDLEEKTKTSASLPKLYSPRETGYKEPGLRPLIMHQRAHQMSTSSLNPNTKDEGYNTTSPFKNTIRDHYEIDISMLEDDSLLPPSFSLLDKVTIDPIISPNSTKSVPSSVNSFSIATLRQYTDSFSQENLMGRCLVGSLYRAQTPTGKKLVIKKLDNGACKSNADFLELVSRVSKLQHRNIVEFVGYCAEHGHQLLIFEYCKNGSLYEALHLDDEMNKNLSWNCRLRLALGGARALEYMHEVCQPPMVHKKFISANILLDEELIVRVADCGLAPLLSSASLNQLSSSGYGAPELESGNYTIKSDVYSFGVVMLEILTGRKSYDRSRPRGEQFLVRWAIHQLHDIDSLAKMVDPSLKGTYPAKSLSRFADIISLCLQPEPEFRPLMSEIVQNLLHMV